MNYCTYHCGFDAFYWILYGLFQLVSNDTLLLLNRFYSSSQFNSYQSNIQFHFIQCRCKYIKHAYFTPKNRTNFAKSNSIHDGWHRKRSTFWVWVIKAAIMVVVKVVFFHFVVYGLRLPIEMPCVRSYLNYTIIFMMNRKCNTFASFEIYVFLIYIRWFMQENEKLIAGLENDNISSVMSLAAWESFVSPKIWKQT